jgi:uncharacterized protein (DUF111 family)
MDQAATTVIEIAANLDDQSGEVVGDAIERLIEGGALDAWVAPITGKKGRPGVCLTVLAAEADCDRLARQVIALTGTFGVRYRQWDRLVLERRHVTVDTSFGAVRVKVGRLDGSDVVYKAEYADAAAVARAAGVPVRQVIDAARAAAAEAISGAQGGEP